LPKEQWVKNFKAMLPDLIDEEIEESATKLKE
jgi:hypothetical protein